jgi:hypothetical protein
MQGGRNMQKLLFMAIALVPYMMLTSCVEMAEQGSVSRRVIYRVEGSAFQAKITYANETNGNTTVTSGSNEHGHMSWSETVTLPAGSMAYLTAQNQSDSGTVVAEILYQGYLVKSSESSGAYCIATASFR